MEVVRDKDDNCIIVCSIENVDPMGVHTGNSITVAPALTLTDKEYQLMRDASIAVLREIGVETGGSNVQFAINPEDGRMVVIEMNPRVSRSSALASKATGFPIAKVAARLAVGYTLDELENDITHGAMPAAFEPTIDYVVTKIPRFAFEKFPGADPVLTTSMKSVGEVMAIGPHLRRIAAEGAARAGNGADRARRDRDPRPRARRRQERRARRARRPRPDRLLKVAQALRLGFGVELVHESCRIDPWFLREIQKIVDTEERVSRARPAAKRKTAPAAEVGRLLRCAARHAFGAERGRRAVVAAAPRRASRLQARRHLRRRVRRADRLHVFDLRGAVRRRAAGRGAAFGADEGHHPGRRAEPHRPGHRVRLLLLPRRLRAEGGRLRIDHGELQPGDGVDRLRHLRPALFRAADGGGRAGDRARRAVARRAARRHRAVRRADAAEARRRAAGGERADPRHLARRHRPGGRPRPLRKIPEPPRPAPGEERHRLFGRAGARSSPPISACRWWCAPPTCWAAGRCRSSAIPRR